MRQQKILIVDDVAIMRTLLKGVLRPFGFSVFDEVSSGEEAISLYETGRHELVFLDIDMPGKDGIQTLREIKAINRRAYVVMVSAHSDTENVSTALAAGADGFVVKSYTPRKVEQMIKHFREQCPALRQDDTR